MVQAEPRILSNPMRVNVMWRGRSGHELSVSNAAPNDAIANHAAAIA